MVSALSAQGNRPYARFVCRRRSFLCPILRLATRLSRLPRSSRGAQSRGHSFIPFTPIFEGSAQSRGHLVFPELYFPVTPLEATLTASSGSVHSKRLTARLSPLECALTKNPGVGSVSFIISLLHCIRVRCRPVDAPLEPRCFPTGKALYPFSLRIVAGLFSSQRGGGTPPPLAGPRNQSMLPPMDGGKPWLWNGGVPGSRSSAGKKSEVQVRPDGKPLDHEE